MTGLLDDDEGFVDWTGVTGRLLLEFYVPEDKRREAADWLALYRSDARATAFNDAADLIDNNDECGCGGCDTCQPRKLAAQIRGLIEPRAARPA